MTTGIRNVIVLLIEEHISILRAGPQLAEKPMGNIGSVIDECERVVGVLKTNPEITIQELEQDLKQLSEKIDQTLKQLNTYRSDIRKQMTAIFNRARINKAYKTRFYEKR